MRTSRTRCIVGRKLREREREEDIAYIYRIHAYKGNVTCPKVSNLSRRDEQSLRGDSGNSVLRD